MTPKYSKHGWLAWVVLEIFFSRLGFFGGVLGVQMQNFLCSVYCREHAGCCWSRENTAQNWVSGRLFCSSLFSSTCKNCQKQCKTLQNTVETLQNTAKTLQNTAKHCRNLAKHSKTLPLVAPNRFLVAPRGALLAGLGWAGLGWLARRLDFYFLNIFFKTPNGNFRKYFLVFCFFCDQSVGRTSFVPS